MFFIKIFHFFVGYVILSLTGNNKEKLITEISKNGCKLTGIDRTENEVTARVKLSDFWKIPQYEKAQLKVIKKGGLPVFIADLWHKKGVLAGILIFAFVTVAGSQFIWEIDFDADKGVDLEKVSAALELSGLKTGVPKRSLKKPEEIKNIVLSHTKDICWCWVYVKGTKATVRLRRSVFPPELLAEDVPCDIIAMKNGIIKRVITKKGRCLVTGNQAVTAGETVISGTFDFAEANGYQVHSRGIVEAYTEHEKTGVYKQNYCYKIYTGRLQRFLTVKLYKWQIPMYIKSRDRFNSYDSVERDFDTGIGLGVKVRELKEYETVREPISYETAVAFAQNELERDISYELLQPAQLVSKSCDAEKIDEETVRVTVKMNFIEEIGTEKRIEEVKVVEPKNNQSAAGD